MTTSLHPRVTDPLALLHGPEWKHRLALAPLTNMQSSSDGSASADDLAWIEMAAAGGHALVMTCATNVQRNGISFPGELGIYSDDHLPGLERIASTVREHGGLSSVQLHHGGWRSLGGGYGRPVAPSDEGSSGARGLSFDEVRLLVEDHVTAALRAQRAGFDGVEIHGAFGWIVQQFLSPRYNRRRDNYGGDLENRRRFLYEVIDEIRASARPDFQIGLRLSMGRFGISLSDLRDISRDLMERRMIDYLDLAPWDLEAVSDEPGFEGRRIVDVFTELPRHGVRIGAGGGIFSAARAQQALDEGLDFAMLGRASIAQPSFPQRATRDHRHHVQMPVSFDDLRATGHSSTFAGYALNYPGFVR